MIRRTTTSIFSVIAWLFLACIGANATQVQVVHYVYDDVGRLVQEVYDNSTVVVYTYDDVGNRTAFLIDTAPDAPSSPSIANGATGVPTSGTISWTGSDPDSGDTLAYDLYLDTNTVPVTHVGSALSSPSFNFQNLTCGTTYYWTVKATDQHGISNVGASAVWNFRTSGCVRNATASTFHETVQGAYDNASDHDTILSQSVLLTGNFSANRDITVTIDGGYNADFTLNPDKTTIQGVVNISNGTVTMTNYIIAQ